MTDFERVEFPSGAHAIMRDPETITERLRRPVRRVQMRIGFDSDLQALIRYQAWVAREALAAEKAAADAGTEFNADEFIPSMPSPVKQQNLTDDQLDLLSNLTDAVTVALVESWSFDFPVSMDALQDLPDGDYRKLLDAASKHRDALLPSFDVDPDPESPTAPSGESAAS